MIPLEALTYSFLFGLLHGILPDEHTWPITFSYAIGGANGRERIKAGFYFSSAFTVQRMLASELAYLALVPYFLKPMINGIVYVVVGSVMAAVLIGLFVVMVAIPAFAYSRREVLAARDRSDAKAWTSPHCTAHGDRTKSKG